MRCLITILLFAAPLPMAAQPANALRDVRLQPGLIMGYPVGDFNHNTSNTFIAGQAKFGVGAGAGIYKSINNKWTIGVVGQVADYSLDKKKLKAQISQHFASPDFYVTNEHVFKTVEVAYCGLAVLYKLNTRTVELEPYVRAGAGFGHVMEDWGRGQVYRKKKDDNYYEKIRMSPVGSNAFFYYALGVSVSKPLYKWFYLCGSMHYTGGTYEQRFSENASDYLDEYHTPTYFTIRQPITALQTELGVQFRFRFIPPHKKVRAEDIGKH